MTIIKLERIKECIFKERFKYEPCRSCSLDYMRTCENYLAEARYDILNRRKPVHTMKLIRQGNDWGVI